MVGVTHVFVEDIPDEDKEWFLEGGMLDSSLESGMFSSPVSMVSSCLRMSPRMSVFLFVFNCVSWHQNKW